MMTKNRFRLFSNCMLVRGHSRSVICDLQRNAYHLIPHTLHDLFNDNQILEFDSVDYSESERVVLSEYIDFLLEKDMVFEVDQDEEGLFPGLNPEWDYPSNITNAIIDVGQRPIVWKDILSQLEVINCYNIQIRFFSETDFPVLKTIAGLLFNSLIQSFELFIGYQEDFNQMHLESFLENNPKLRSVIIYGAPENKQLASAHSGFGGAYWIEQKLSSHLQCGIINPSYFSVNIETFTEALQHNTCLNRKISIDIDGNIKNCPGMQESFGNIETTRLSDVVPLSAFQRKWHIQKDSIEKCRDCEFRYICTDCRAFIEEPENEYSAPLKCGYNPYTCTWEEWSSNPLKKQAVSFYGL